MLCPATARRRAASTSKPTPSSRTASSIAPVDVSELDGDRPGGGVPGDVRQRLLGDTEARGLERTRDADVAEIPHQRRRTAEAFLVTLEVPADRGGEPEVVEQ
jgi:hypothetical protein